MASIHSIKPKNLVRQPATPAQQDYWKEIIRYGDDDNFPLRLARLVQNSPTASSCIDTKADFIAGDGFSDATLSDRIMNGRKERLGDIHNVNSDAYATFEGFALEVKYNGHGLISEVFNIPFEYCRFAPPDSKGVITKIRYNPYFGTGEYKPEFTKVYDVYNPDKKVVLAQQNRDKTKYQGQILYVATTGPLSRFYPAPKYYSAHFWMAVDEAIGGFHKNNVENNFFQSVLLKMIGRENDPSTHPDDVIWNADNTAYEVNPKKTIGDRFNVVMQQFTGWENSGNIMTLWAEMKEAMPELQAFPSNTNSELFKTLQELATENITRATKTPAILANIQSGASLGGDGNAIRASVKLMQQRVVKIQAMLERVYKDILSHMDQPYAGDVKIIHYNPFPEMEKLDPLIWAALTVDEQRKWIKKNTDFEIIDTPAVATPPPSAPTNQFSNVSYTNYPEKARQTAQKALNFRNESGAKCGGPAGWKTTQDIIDGKPISFKMIQRIARYLEKNQQFSNNVFSDSCESVLFSAWGGNEMLVWAKSIISSVNE